jgi:DNA-directed RNA polymerase subunit omega
VVKVARITIEDCLKTGYNKFTLVHLAEKRVIQFKKGKEPLLITSNKEIVTALREIAAGKVKMKIGDDLLQSELIDNVEELEGPEEEVAEITHNEDSAGETEEE